MAEATKPAERASLQVSYIWLYVKDPQRSLQFYRDVLGLDVVETFPDGALLNAGKILLGIHREEGNRKSQPGGTVIILETKDIQETYEELRRRGATFLSEIEQQPYGKVASLKDRDGYVLELWEAPQSD